LPRDVSAVMAVARALPAVRVFSGVSVYDCPAYLDGTAAADPQGELQNAECRMRNVGRGGCAWLGPDEQARLSELDDRIFAALDNLPEEQRMAFILRTVEDMSLEDIAVVMQCPVNTVRSRRLLAIKRLREVLRGLLVL
jgi:RNA polymerase sigma factor (sigma-70 family)